jgi:hypothetical protein
LETQPWLERVVAELEKWLSDKLREPVSIEVGAQKVVINRPGVMLRVIQQQDRTVRALHAEFRETNQAGTWIVEIAAAEDSKGGGWLALNASSASGQPVSRPRIALNLFSVLNLVDGGMRVAPDAAMVTPARVDELLSALLSSDRRGPVLVAATDDQLPFDAFREQVTAWARETVGLAHVAVLTPPATVQFAETVGDALAVKPWSIRTFRPDMTLEDAHERHRILSFTRLALERDDRLRTLLGRIARDELAEMPEPSELAALRRRFERIENARLGEAITSRRTPTRPLPTPRLATPVTAPPPPAPQIDDGPPRNVIERAARDALIEHYERERAKALDVLGVDTLDEAVLLDLLEQLTAPPEVAFEVQRRLEAQQEEIESLRAARVNLMKERDDALESYAIEASERESAVSRARWLDRTLAQHQAVEAYGVLPAEEVVAYPDTLSEIFDRADALERMGVVLTADRSLAEEVDARTLASTTAHIAWDALMVLADYLRACAVGDHSGDVAYYLQSTPDGYASMSPGKHRRSESEPTMAKYGHQRVLPVPKDVEPSGSATMVAHFRLGQVGGMKAPRMYYLIDPHGRGRVYVGYIGTHMDNIHSN